MRKRIGMSIIVALLGLLVTSCGSGVGNSPGQATSNWTVTANKYALRSSVKDAFYGSYKPDDGYAWLVITLTMRNNSKADKCLSWLQDDFTFVSSNGNQYGDRLVLNTPVNQLPACYGPEQAKSGDIFFEVPSAMNVGAGRLLFRPQGGSTVTLTLNGIPHESDFLDASIHQAVDAAVDAYATSVATNDVDGVVAAVTDPVIVNGVSYDSAAYRQRTEQTFARYVYSTYTVTNRQYLQQTDGSVKVQGTRNYRYHDNATGFDGSGSVSFIAVIRKVGSSWLISELIVN